jgi:hypothetical protein
MGKLRPRKLGRGWTLSIFPFLVILLVILRGLRLFFLFILVGHCIIE